MLLSDGCSDIPAGKIAAVVTHLEMTAPPERRDTPPGAWRLRKVERPAPDWYRDLYRRVGEAWLWFTRAGISDTELTARIDVPGVEIYALVVNGRDEGLLELDFSEAGNCELVYFGVTAKLIGTGAGRYLMNRALELAWRSDVQRVWVHTCTFDHPAALAFYLRSGFRPFRRQIEVADDPRLDGTMPRDAARHVPVIGSTIWLSCAVDAPVAGVSSQDADSVLAKTVIKSQVSPGRARSKLQPIAQGSTMAASRAVRPSRRGQAAPQDDGSDSSRRDDT